MPVCGHLMRSNRHLDSSLLCDRGGWLRHRFLYGFGGRLWGHFLWCLRYHFTRYFALGNLGGRDLGNLAANFDFVFAFAVTNFNSPEATC